MRKILPLLLILAMLTAMIVPAAAAGKPTVSISSGTVKAGEDVTLTVSIEDNPGLATCMLYIYYDTDVFSVDTTYGITTEGAFRATGTLVGNDIATAKANGNYAGMPSKDGVIVLWFNGSGNNTTADGKMMSIKFSTSKNALNGDYSISLGCSSDSTSGEDGVNVSVHTSAATVTVTGGTGTKTDKDKTLDEKLFPDGVVPEFTDTKGHWAQKYIEDAAALGLIQGYNGLYRPNDTMTRAECVTILWRANGAPTPTKKASFTDLDKNQTWYHDAVAWAEQNGVVDGIGNGKFDPNGKVTREQLATILFRQSGGKSGMELMFAGTYNKGFTDSAKVGDWAKNGLYWAIYNEIYCGVRSTEVGNALYPKEPANRAQIAVMMVRYLAYMDK